MKKVDMENWQEFEISYLFDIIPTKSYKMTNKDLMNEDGKNPVVVNSSYNNGIGGFTNQNITEKGNVITFSDTTNANSIFYQSKDFVGYSHVQKLKPIRYYDKWNKYTLMYFMTIFKIKAKSINFDYVNKFTREEAKKIVLKLPIKNNEPDWEYMGKYMKNLEKKETNNIYLIRNSIKNFNKSKIDIHKWKRFHLYDDELFEIYSGTKLDKKNMTTKNPSINFIGRSNFNNGVIEMVDLIPNIKPYKKGTLTLSLGGSYIGSCFIQNEDYYTSQNVIVLENKRDISYYAKQFIATVIFKEAQTYYKAFEDELNRHIKTDFSILLPINMEGYIDFNYMDNYMKILENYVKKMIKNN